VHNGIPSILKPAVVEMAEVGNYVLYKMVGDLFSLGYSSVRNVMYE